MPTTNNYGAYNPAAVDPYPIETDLAKLAVGNSPENAANLLDLYQLQRTTDAANYGHEMGIQHDFAKQQLAQQLQEQYLKSGQEALKTPGGLRLMASQAPGSLGNNFGPDQVGAYDTGLVNAQQAGTFEKAASGAYHAVQAGFPPNLTGLTNLTSGMLDTQGTPLQLQVEGMKQAGHNARAGGAAGDKTKFNIMVDGGVDENMNPIKMNVPIRMSDTDDQIRAKGRAALNARNLIYPPGTGVGGATPPANVAGPSPPASTPARPQAPQQRSQTSLPNNPNAAPQGGPQAASSQYIRDPKTQGAAKVGFQHLTPEGKAQVGAQVQLGGVMPIVPLVGGGVGYVGKNGRVYTIPPAGSN